MTLPNFLIVGAAKAGTTSLYYYMQQHPEISFPKLKEPKYFSSKFLKFPHNGPGDKSVDKYAVKNWVEYKKLFENLKNKYVGEASPDYLFYSKFTANEIFNTLGDIPIIIILRDPVKRAFSAFSYLVRDSRETLTFSEALEKEEERLANNWDFIWGYKKGSLYYYQIAEFKKYFSKIKLIIFEEFVKNTKSEVNNLYNFLSLPSISDLNLQVHNPSGIPTNILTKYILSRESTISTSLREILKRIVPRSILEDIAAKSLTKLELESEIGKKLYKHFENDIILLETMFNLNLNIWKKWK